MYGRLCVGWNAGGVWNFLQFVGNFGLAAAGRKRRCAGLLGQSRIPGKVFCPALHIPLGDGADPLQSPGSGSGAGRIGHNVAAAFEQQDQNLYAGGIALWAGIGAEANWLNRKWKSSRA